MYVVEVSPLVKGGTTDTLTYYSAESLPVGTLVSVPLRKQTVTALVVDTQPVSTAKTALKAATFSLRKLNSDATVGILPESIKTVANKLAEIYPSPIGTIIQSILPPEIRRGMRSYPTSTSPNHELDSVPYVLTGTTSDRYMSYRSLVRETFAKGGSTLFVVPTTAFMNNAVATLTHGIERRVITFSSSHGKRQLDKAYEALADTSEAKLIITTPSHAFIERTDITSIIVDNAGNPNYRQRTRPYLDIREVLKHYARATGRGILLGDLVVSTEDEWRRQEDRYQTYEEHVQRVQFNSAMTIVERNPTETAEQTFTIIQPDTMAAIKRVLKARGKVFLYAARRGLAPAVLCYDCGHVFRCPDSGAPYSLLRTYDEDGSERRWFVSQTSGTKLRASDTCPSCGGWRLREQGFGIQQVVDEISERLPSVPLITFDHTTATTHRKAAQLTNQFVGSKGVLMIGTAMSLPYLPDNIDLSVITSYEATRSMTTWRADERILALLYALRERTSMDLYIQTRSGPDPILKFAQKGQLDAFYTDDISIRESLQYPPFATFILLTMVGSKTAVKQTESIIDATLPTCPIQYYNSPNSTEEQVTRYGLIKRSMREWPDPELMAGLRRLPPYVKVEIDPDRIV